MTTGNENDSEQQNPFDDESLRFTVLVNAQQQYSLWPQLPTRRRWRVLMGPASRGECIDYIETHWQDMRPAALKAADAAR
ncbi:MbtH family protein [Serratia ureilytica]